MCGIAGFVNTLADQSEEELRSTVTRMTATLRHRGPDAEGAWAYPEDGIALGFRRLAILDLSPAGNQPMVSACQRYTVVFNGEVYNFRDLRREIEGSDRYLYSFTGYSDTEVLLSAFSLWGIAQTLPKLNGMFAFAVWDRQERVLTLCRDRIGEKPLYYGFSRKHLLFGSELKAIRGHGAFSASLNKDSLMLYFRGASIPAPHSIYRGFYKLEPGRFVSWDARKKALGPVKTYWSGLEHCEQAIRVGYYGSETDALSELEARLSNSIRLRQHADVPLGAFLSGGIDSSLLVTLMQKTSPQPVRTFTIGFSEKKFDETAQARRIASRLGTDHTEMIVSAKDALDLIPSLPHFYDEPFADSSQIPTFLLCQLAKQHVTVCLTGDGGDELFGGYHRHTLGRTATRLSRLPKFAKNTLASLLRRLSASQWNDGFEIAKRLLPKHLHLSQPGEKIEKLALLLDSIGTDSICQFLSSQWIEPSEIVLDGKEPPNLFNTPAKTPSFEDFTLRMLYYDLVGYLPDVLLVKLDRAAMGNSLETRVPYLDHLLVEFAWSLPLRFKIRGTRTKHILRQLLYQYLPKEWFDTPKMGFSIPLSDWLRGPLREWGEALLHARRLREQGILNTPLVQKRWEEHQSGKRNWHNQLWSVLMLEAWMDTLGNQKDSCPPSAQPISRASLPL